MADKYAYTGLEVVARHEPEAHYETDANGMRQQVELPGFITLGVLIDGHFVGIGRYHAAEVHEGIARAQSQDAEQPDVGSAAPQPGQ